MLVVEDSSSIPNETEVLASQPDNERTFERWEDNKSGRETLHDKGMERDLSPRPRRSIRPQEILKLRSGNFG